MSSSSSNNDQQTRSTHLMEVVDRVREMHVQKSGEADSSSLDFIKRRREDAAEADDEDAGMSTSSDDDQPLDFSKSKKNKNNPSLEDDEIKIKEEEEQQQQPENVTPTPPPPPPSSIRQQIQFGGEGFIGNLLNQHNNRPLCSDGNSDRSSESSPRRNSPLPSNMNAAAALLTAVASQQPTPNQHSSFQTMAAAAAVNALASSSSSSANPSPELDQIPTGLLTTVPHDYRAIGLLRAAALLRGHNEQQQQQSQPQPPPQPQPQIPNLDKLAERPKMSADLEAFLNHGESKFAPVSSGLLAPSTSSAPPTPHEIMELHRVKNESDNNFLQYRSTMMSQIESTRPKGRRPSNNRSPNNNPENKLRDPGYVERRKKNNEAAKRSRDARRTKENEIAVRAQFLETENGELKMQLAALRSEIASLRIRIYGTANPPNQNGPIV